MKEARDLVRAWRSLPAGSDAVLATVVATSGSTYRRPGARMLMANGRWLAGSLSGGCIESDALSTAWDRTEKGSVIVTYDASADEDIIWGFGLGCNGTVDVLFERVDEQCVPLRAIEETIRTRETRELATIIASSDPSRIGEHSITANSRKPQEKVFEEKILPPRQLVIFGKGHDVGAVKNAAEALGWEVLVTSPPTPAPPDEAPQGRGHDSNAAVLIMSHNYLLDQQALKEMLGSQVGYIGLLGPRRRAERMLHELNMEFDDRLHAPVGLDIGAEGPEQIALAIVAEIQAWFAGRAGGFLRDSQASIHNEPCNLSA